MGRSLFRTTHPVKL